MEIIINFFRSIDPVWVSLGPILLINIVLLSSLVFFLATKERWPVPLEVQTRHNSRFLSGTLKHWWYWTNQPIAKFFVRLKITPNMLTLMGFLMSVVATFFYAKGLFGFAGWIMIFGATFDLFDGQVARLTGKVSKSGAFFDSVMDRFGEGIIFLGLVLYFRDSWILYFLILALIGSMSVSYTRARGEAVGVDVRKGSMQRPERIVYLGCASIFQPLLSYFLNPIWPNHPPVLVLAAIVMVGVMTNVTSVYRMIYVMNELDNKEKRKSDETIPQILAKLTTDKGRETLRSKWRQKLKAS